eukprot:1800373-Pyramimonas_sp.AAC.1
MDEDPPAFRANVAPFVNATGGSDGRRAARALLSQPQPAVGQSAFPPMSKTDTYLLGSSNEYVGALLVLNETRYISYHMFWDRISEEEA